MKHILRGFAVYLDDVCGDRTLEDSDAVIAVTNRIADPAARRFADEAYLVMVHGLMCWLTGKRIVLACSSETPSLAPCNRKRRRH